MRLTGWLAVGAGLAFFGADVYLFAVMGPAGWNVDMFDRPEDLLPWVAGHHRLYQGLWLLYFVSQALLLLVPWRVGEYTQDRSTGLLGTVSVAIAMVGLGVILAASPVTAQAYSDGVSGTVVLALHNAAADIGKDLRLLSEVLLGIWLAIAGRQIRHRTGARAWWTLTGIGAVTTMVAAVKLFYPAMPVEDYLGFALGIAYVLLGAAFLRLGRQP